MLVAPSNIKLNKILKDRTINFETSTKTHGNMVIIPTLDRNALISVIKGNLFRPMQLLCLYTPRKVKPIGRSATIINQKDYYSEMRVATNGRIKKGKTLISAYGGQNLVYDIYNDYKTSLDIFINRGFTRQRLQKECFNLLDSLILNASSDSDYKDVFLVFPITKPIENFQRVITGTEFESSDPTVLFIQSLIKDTLDKNAYKNIKRVFFYVPKGEILLAIDLFSEDFQREIPNFQAKLRRLNNYVMGTDNLEDELNDVEDEEITAEDKIENKKEEIKQIVFKQIAQTIHANNLNDFEAASRDEKDLIVLIDDKIEKYLKKPENLKKSLNDMIDEVNKDTDIKLKALRYVETKKGSILRADNLAKGLEKETELIGNLQDLDDDSKENVAEKFEINMHYIDERITKSHLASLDDEYNKKQSMTDLTNVISAFSNSEYSPMTVDSISFEESSTDQDEKRTAHVKYKTDDGKTLSFQLDIPKIVDKRYLYLGGNKKVIKKQLIRLPIVKTKSDRVEITTNYNKMTIERTNGKLSRKNAYILKKLKDMKENPGFEIEYGDNSAVNVKLGYSNDFEYEELASYINKINSGKYILIFNRDVMKDEVDTLDIPDNFITSDNKRTPLGFEKIGDDIKALIFIENQKIMRYDLTNKNISEVSNSIFDFLCLVLKLDMTSLPAIGKSFIYTKVKFLQTTYPVLAIVASQKGLTNILERYNVEYFKSEKQQRKNIDYVEVKFKDCYLYYKDEIKNTLLLNALYLMNTQDYNYSDFDSDTPYTQYFINSLGESVGIHTRNTLKINLAVVIDPITRDVLRDLKLPTDIIDVLLYANTLLINNQYKTQNDMTNYRVRSNELVADIMYGMIADAYVNYCKHKINGRALNLTVPKGALISKLQQEPNINDKSTLNPVIEAEQIAQASAKRL